MPETSTPTTHLVHAVDADKRHVWRLASDGDAEWTEAQQPVVMAYQTIPGRTEVYTLPESRTEIDHHKVLCDLSDLSVELIGFEVVVSAGVEPIARVPLHVCAENECGQLAAERHATGLCLWCEAVIGDCYRRECRVCYPLSWQQAGEPLRTWSVIFELTYTGRIRRVDGVEAANEVEALETAMRDVFDFDQDDADHFRSKNIRSSHVFETPGAAV